jgi:NADH:ubiquinone oxidoreductase subunit E
MLRKRTIIICLGSSCFSRGNSNMLTHIHRFIRLHQLEDKVSFNGDHCFSECSEGPNMRIDGRLIQNVTTENINEILERELRDLIEYAD